jgi:hypothetical protein
MPVILHNDTHKNIIEILGIVGFTNFIFVEEDELVNIETAYTFGKSALFYDALEKDLNDFRMNEELLVEFIKFIQGEVLYYKSDQDSKPKVFFWRDSGARNLVNIEELMGVAAKSGYKKIKPYDLSFHDQVNLIYDAEKIILTGGASMANLMFAKPGIDIIYLTNSFLKFYNLPQFICDLSKNQVTTIYGKSKISSLSNVWTPYDLFHADYAISPRNFASHI